MKMRFLSIWIILLLAVTLAGCGNITAINQPTATPSGPPLGDQVRNEPGGYTYRTIPEFNTQTSKQLTLLIAPEGNPTTGPGLFMTGSFDPARKNMTALDYLTLYLHGLDYLSTDTQEIDISGVDGAIMELVGSPENLEMQGRMAVLVPEPGQHFLIMGVADTGKWAELEPWFEAVLASMEFFPPVAATPTP